MTELEDFGREFAADLQELIRQAFPTSRAVRCVSHGDRVVIRPGSTTSKPVNLRVSKRRVAKLDFTYDIEWGPHTAYPAVTRSEIRILPEATNRPVLRYEYLRDSASAPSAHWHVHGESTELGRILSSSQHRGITMRDLHLPVGGTRFRPGLEDVIEFLVVDMKVDRNPEWRQAIRQGREAWRSKQAQAVARDTPEVVAQVLRDLGYDVTSPSGHRGPRLGSRLLHY